MSCQDKRQTTGAVCMTDAMGAMQHAMLNNQDGVIVLRALSVVHGAESFHPASSAALKVF